MKPKRFANSWAARQFRAACRDAVNDGMGQKLVDRWETAHLAFNKLRIGGDRPTPDKTATEILAEEAAAWEALNHALPQASRAEATGLRVLWRHKPWRWEKTPTAGWSCFRHSSIRWQHARTR